jgi:membrane protease YdiL (CAAX protease family)
MTDTLRKPHRPDMQESGAAALIGWLRDCPWARSGIYFGAAVVILQQASAMHPDETQDTLLATHLTALPFGALLTYAMQRVEQRPVSWKISPAQARQFSQGAALGASAFLGLIGAAAAKGWVAAPSWGWERAPGAKVARSIALQSVGHLAVAWNEEMVFRGYGFAVLREAVGQPIAIGILVPLFALAHAGSAQVRLGQAALGSALMALRLSSGSIWAPLGYHWAWNVVQTALLGPTDGMPSLRPLTVTGPYTWIGRPGHPEPGLLSAIVQGCVALGVGLIWRLVQENAAHPNKETL